MPKQFSCLQSCTSYVMTVYCMVAEEVKVLYLIRHDILIAYDFINLLQYSLSPSCGFLQSYGL